MYHRRVRDTPGIILSFFPMYESTTELPFIPLRFPVPVDCPVKHRCPGLPPALKGGLYSQASGVNRASPQSVPIRGWGGGGLLAAV